LKIITKDEFLKSLESATWEIKWFIDKELEFEETNSKLISFYILKPYNLKASVGFFLNEEDILLHLFLNKLMEISWQDNPWSDYEEFEKHDFSFLFWNQSEAARILSELANKKIIEFWINFITEKYEELSEWRKYL
jgi:hypothetical protein